MQWVQIEKFVRLLRPVENFAKQLQLDESNLGLLIPLLHAMVQAIENISDKDLHGVKATKVALVNAIWALKDGRKAARFGGIYSDKVVVLSMVLDPRYKFTFLEKRPPKPCPTVDVNAVKTDVLSLLKDEMPLKANAIQANEIGDDDPFMLSKAAFTKARQ